MIKVTINNSDGKGDVDYTQYILPASISIQKSINIPTTCTFSLVASDNAFIVPIPRCYVRIYSTTYKKYLFTGYLVTDPATTFVGLSQTVPGTDFQMYQFDLSCTSDEYILGLHSMPFISAFVNQSQGQILKLIAETLMPGFFDYTYVASGDMVPYLAYDPTKTWYEYAKQFGDASRFRYSVINKEIHYQPYGDGDLGISYDTTLGEGTFDPSQFKAKPFTVPIVNDATIIGSQEGGNHREDHFIGDGFTGAFPLKHKVFGLETNYQGSSVLLVEPWSNKSLNTQNWFAQDPAGQFDYSAGALNIIAGVAMPDGLSYIRANNAVELAGSLVCQHGEVQFNDKCSGTIGGIYNDSTMMPASCLAGFDIESGPVVNVTLSGASGIEITPILNGIAISGAFVVTSQINKSYTLFTRVSSPLPVRYYQVFRSLAGSAYGGYTTAPSVTGSITFGVLETDMFSGDMTNWTYTASGCILPDTATYGLVNNRELNITLNSTSLWTPPPASLFVQGEIGAGILSPIYVSGIVQYTGAFVSPSGGNLPITGFGPEQQFDLGSGIGNQAGELDSGQQVDTLNFYSNDMPGVGTRIRLQSWESQVAVSRVQSSGSIQTEAAVVGDDGIRATIVTNLSPLPRTSEDCDNAAAAYIKDRISTFYQGSYNASFYFFSQFTNDIDFFPTCGRYLYVNAPNQRINRQNMLVSQVTIAIQEMKSEIINYNITFGPDTYVEKVLAAILPYNTNTYQPLDTAIQPTPQEEAQIGFNYLPDIYQTTVVSFISGAQFALNFLDALAKDAQYEVRSGDINWGTDDGLLLFRLGSNQQVIMPRTQYDQSWFIRQVSGVGTSNVQSSRRTKVIRIMYPRIPSPPIVLTADTANVNMDLSGDTRNIEGLELRQADDVSVCYRTIVGTRFDTFIDMDLLRNQLLPGESGLTGLGQYLIAPFASGSRLLQAHFFNLMWEYSPALAVNMPPFGAPIVELGYRWGPQVQLNIATQPQDATRTDCAFTHAQFFNVAPTGSFFLPSALQLDIMQAGNSGQIATTFPVTGDIWIQAQFVDHIGSGAWCNVIHIPQGDLIASDYLSAQGSVPPAILANLSVSGGGIFYYATSGTVIDMYSLPFMVWFPNNQVANVPGATGVYTAPLDVTGNLVPLTDYGFFPSVKNVLSSQPLVELNGPYANYAGTSSIGSLTGMYQDGSVPLVSTAFVVQTAAATGTGGGGGGGTYGGGPGGGGGCGVLTSKLQLHDRVIELKDAMPGMLVKTPKGTAVIDKLEDSIAELFEIRAKSGCRSIASTTHILNSRGMWISLEDLYDLIYLEEEKVCVKTILSDKDELFLLPLRRSAVVRKIFLSQGEHYYLLDGFWCHNKTPGASRL